MSREEAVENFVKFLRIRTDTSKDLAQCVELFETYAKKLGVQSKVLYYEPNLPVYLLTIPGRDLSLPSILLNSHMDVVPVSEENWTKPPWEGYIDEETGNIYGRGAQDMKSVTIQYFEALLRLKQNSISLLRTVHLSIVPDEEVFLEIYFNFYSFVYHFTW